MGSFLAPRKSPTIAVVDFSLQTAIANGPWSHFQGLQGVFLYTVGMVFISQLWAGQKNLL